MGSFTGFARSTLGQHRTVVMDQLTKSAHFLPVEMSYSMEMLAQIYLQEVVRIHGVPEIIISDRDPRFLSRFWVSLSKALEPKYHPRRFILYRSTDEIPGSQSETSKGQYYPTGKGTMEESKSKKRHGRLKKKCGISSLTYLKVC